MEDIIIIGAGPAGLTAALYALRANKKVTIFEAKTFGGQIAKASTVENYPAIEKITGAEFATRLYEQVNKLGAKFIYETVIKVDENKKVYTTNNEYSAKAIIIATGSENRKLNIENEDTFIGRGVSYCASCDGNFYKNKIVAVVGGGNTALEDAVYLSNIVKELYLIHRTDSFDGDNKNLTELENKENVKIIHNSNVIKINGNMQVESIIVQDKDKNNNEIKVDGIFIDVGQEPKNEIFKNIVELDKYGYIITKNDVYTNVKGIYVAGDTRVKTLRQLTTAVSDGSLAATAAIKEMED